ncbi:hypothetical protein M434DRAFT_31236 [Hypoxylon sp. CO27-5]|nr:hypothetical protein M434DRAFT_31236 [Hypoxylon sp. CO27-5]
MADDRRKHGSRARHRSSSSRPRRSPQSRQQGRRAPKGSNDVCTIPEENGEIIEYHASTYGSSYGHQDSGGISPIYGQSNFNMMATLTTAPPTPPLYAPTVFPISLPAGSQAEASTEVPAYEPTSTNSDYHLASRSSDYYSDFDRLTSSSAATMSIDPWRGSYRTHPSSSDSYPNAGFTSDDAGSYTQPLSYSQIGGTSPANLNISETPSPLSSGALNDEDNVLEGDQALDQGQDPYSHRRYRRGSTNSNHHYPTRRLSMQNNQGSVVSLPDQTAHGGEQACFNSEDLSQGVITDYVKAQSPWSPMNLKEGGYDTNISSAYDDNADYDLEQ